MYREKHNFTDEYIVTETIAQMEEGWSYYVALSNIGVTKLEGDRIRKENKEFSDYVTNSQKHRRKLKTVFT